MFMYNEDEDGDRLAQCCHLTSKESGPTSMELPGVGTSSGP